MKHKKVIIFLLILFTTLHAPSLVKVPISIGDLIDKITILQVKLEKIEDQEKLKNVHYELECLQATFHRHVPSFSQLPELSAALKEVNSKLWDIENGTRAKEAKKEFDAEFIELARSVYINNNLRHALKREINVLTGSRIIEEKQYTVHK